MVFTSQVCYKDQYSEIFCTVQYLENKSDIQPCNFDEIIFQTIF